MLSKTQGSRMDVLNKARVVVIGTGKWGFQHAKVFSQLRNASLCAIVGRTEEKTKERAALFSVPYYLSIDEMLEREKPDLVSLCVPGSECYQLARRVIDANIALLIEKPLTYRLDEAEILVMEAAKRNLFFAINFIHRYAKPVQLAHKAVSDNKIGKIILNTWRMGQQGSCLHHPFGNLIETQCHGFDLVEYLCGNIVSVMAEMTDMTDKGFTTLTLSLRFENGAVGSFVGTYDAPDNYLCSQQLDILGTTGRIIIEDLVKRYVHQRIGHETATVWQAGLINDEDRSVIHSFNKHAFELIQALLEGRQPPIPASVGIRSLQLAYAAIESFTTGKRVHITG